MPRLGRLTAISKRQQELMKLPKTMIMLSGMYEAPHILSHEAIIYNVMGVDNIALDDSD